MLRIQLPAAPGCPPGTVRVEVADASDHPPLQRHADREETNGRGLELVDGLADRWGWQPEGEGKRIWCEIDPHGAAPAPDFEVDAAPEAHGYALPQGF